MTVRPILAALWCLTLALGTAVAQDGKEDICRRGDTAV